MSSRPRARSTLNRSDPLGGAISQIAYRFVRRPVEPLVADAGIPSYEAAQLLECGRQLNVAVESSDKGKLRLRQGLSRGQQHAEKDTRRVEYFARRECFRSYHDLQRAPYGSRAVLVHRLHDFGQRSRGGKPVNWHRFRCNLVSRIFASVRDHFQQSDSI